MKRRVEIWEEGQRERERVIWGEGELYGEGNREREREWWMGIEMKGSVYLKRE